MSPGLPEGSRPLAYTHPCPPSPVSPTVNISHPVTLPPDPLDQPMRLVPGSPPRGVIRNRLQVLVAQWPVNGWLKFAFIMAVNIVVLLASYHTCVRYTWIGRLLNGPRERPENVTRG